MEKLLMPVPENKEIAERTGGVVAQAKAITITDQPTFEKAGDFLKGLKTLQDQISRAFDPFIQQAHLTHKAGLDAKKRFYKPTEDAEKIVKPKVATYLQDKEKERRKEEARLQAEANKKAEQEALDRAEELEAAGDPEAAEKALEEIDAPPVVAPTQVEKVEGVSMGIRWKAQCVDLEKLVKAVARGEIPLAAIKADEVFLNRQATALKELMKPWERHGVKVWQEANVRAGKN